MVLVVCVDDINTVLVYFPSLFFLTFISNTHLLSKALMPYFDDSAPAKMCP
jgi:hypothetical protein